MSYKLRNHNTFVRRQVNSVFNGTETLSCPGPKTWDLVPNEIKQSDSLKSFKMIDSTIVKGKLPYFVERLSAVLKIFKFSYF